MTQVQYPLLNNFSRGELSSRVEGRVDIAGYYQGCKQMENCIIVSQGGAEKRPGTIHIGDVYDPNNFGTTARLVTFEVNDEETYILEIGHLTIRIWNSQTKELVSDLGNGKSYFDTEYSGIEGADEVSELQFATTEGVLFLAHKNHKFQFIKRTKDIDGNITFAIEEHHTQVFGWDSGTTYAVGDVVYSAGDYWTAVVENSAETPAVGSWRTEIVSVYNSDESVGPTGDITEYVTGSFSAGDFRLFGGKLYYALRDFTAPEDDQYTCQPGLEIYDYEWDEGKVQMKEFPRSGWSEKKIIEDLKEKYTSDTTRVVIIHIESASGWWFTYDSGWYEYRIDTLVPTSTYGTDNQYWDSVIGLPGGSDVHNLYHWDGGDSGDKGDVYYDANYVTYTCLADGSTSTPGTTPSWVQLEGNPFFTLDGDYPAAVAFMGDRLYLGGTTSHPQTMYASKLGDYSDFNLGIADDSSFSFEIASERSSRIKWMMAKDNLMIGTTSSEWLISGGSISNITATNVQVLRQSAYGSSYSQAHFVADSLLFYQKGGRKLREYMYSNDNKAYLANDLTLYADHITEAGVLETAYQQNPDSIYWNVLKNGDLVGLTYDRLNSIAGWHRHTTTGNFESVCSIDGAYDEEELWVVVKRSVNGVSHRFIEVFAPRQLSLSNATIYSDCSSTFVAGDKYGVTSILNNITSIQVSYDGVSGLADGDNIKLSGTDNSIFDYQVFEIENIAQGEDTGTFDLNKNGETFTADEFDEITDGLVSRVETIITGLDHLEGETVTILGDGAVFSEQEVGAVTGGIGIELNTACNTVVCGLPYVMVLQPESIELGPSTVSKSKRVSKVLLKLYNALGGTVSAGATGEAQDINYRTTDVLFGRAPSLFTGTIEVPVDSSSELEATVIIRNEQPLPMGILAIVSDISYTR